jgi:hypothetical protein
MGNLDFAGRAGFSWYCVLLLVGGATTVTISLLRRQSQGGRIANLGVGGAFLCYGFYLTFGFHGGTYYVFYWVLILPVLLIVRTIRSIKEEQGGTKVRQRQEAKQTYYAELQEAQEAHTAAVRRQRSDK